MSIGKYLNLVAASALTIGMSFAATAAERSIIVLDASGSMWGQIGQKAKIEIARDTLGEVLSTVPAESELGLMVYGHREKGSCKDIELAVAPAKGTADAIAKFARLIKPKGKTPLSASVKQAAEALRYTEDKATVILVTDGLETCDADPCALGRELESSGVDFTAHVVGFGLSDEDGKQVACLAEETGGKYLKAEDAGALGDALTATVVEAAAEPEPEPEPARPEFNVVVSAHLSEGGPVIENDGSVRWDFYPIAEDGSVSKKSQGGAYGAERMINLDAGAYKMRTKLGRIVLEREIEVSDTEAYEDDVVFNAGILTVTPKRTAEDTEAEKNARIDVKFGSLKDGTYGKAPLYVAAGEVLITGKIGKAVVQETITVAAGEIVERDIVIASGAVVPSAVYSEDGPAVDTNEIRFTIQTAKQDLSGKRKNINGKYGAGGTIEVPAGEVVMHARLGLVEVTSEPFSVKGGDATEVSVNLNAGVLAVTAPDTNRYQILSPKKDINGKHKRIGQGSGAEWQQTLPAGDYIIEVFDRWTKNKRHADVSVHAGQRTEISIEE